MDYITLGKILRDARVAIGLTQSDAAKRVGVTFQNISSWERGKSKIDIESLSTLCSLYDISVTGVLTIADGDDSFEPPSRGVKIPVLGTVAAGIPIEAVEEILDYEEITPQMAACGEYFALQIRGSSMEPRMVEGDVVIVRQQSDVDSGDIAVVLVNGNEATVKKIRKQENGLSLIPSNPSYDVMFFTPQEVESLPVRIIGKVVELRAKM